LQVWRAQWPGAASGQVLAGGLAGQLSSTQQAKVEAEAPQEPDCCTH